MAIARKIDPAALACAFADEISAFPEVKRLWYRYHPNSFSAERMSLDLTIQVAGESKAAEGAISDALEKINTDFWDDLSAGSLQFTLSEHDVFALNDLVGPDFIEIPLREA